MKEALKLALEAYLCREMPAGTVIGDPKWWAAKIANAIKEALAQPEHIGFMDSKLNPIQRTWVGLTDEDLEAEFGFIDELLRDCCYRTEAKLRSKNEN